MPVIPLGGSLVIMQGFDRQKKVARDPRKKARRVHYRRYVVPSLTRESLPARANLAAAAHEFYGRSFEELISHIVATLSGKDYGGKAKKKALREARHEATRKKLEEWKRLASEWGVADKLIY